MRDTLRSFFVPPISGDSPQSRAKLVWIVRLRWIAISAQVFAILPALEFEILERGLLPTYAGVIVALASINLLSWLLIRGDWNVREGHILAQLGVDIAALSCLLALTGGAWNPLVPILFVHTGLGALLLEGRSSLLFLALLVGCLALIQAYSHIPPGLHPPQPPSRILFPAQFVLALAFWILTSWLSLTLGSLQREFSLLRERKTRIDRLRAIGALAAGLSHEFATPLNTAQLKLERLARVRGLTGDSDLNTASEALNRCREVLRNMAGAQLRPEGLVLETVDVPALVEQVCRGAAQDCAEASIEFLREGRGGGWAVLPDIAFSQAILNLIDNALEAGNPNGPVQIEVRTRPDRVDVSVFDRGNGWPEVVRRHLGEPFVTTRPDGVGLGLYYVHTLVEALGAELHLDDRPEGGAIARISLPAATAGGSDG